MKGRRAECASGLRICDCVAVRSGIVISRRRLADAQQLALAVPLLAYYEFFNPDSPYAIAVIALAGSLGVITALFNLAPIAGLDGSVVWWAVKEGRSRHHVVRRIRQLDSTPSPEDAVVEALDRFRRKR